MRGKMRLKITIKIVKGQAYLTREIPVTRYGSWYGVV